VTYGGSNLNDFPENQLTQVLAVERVFRQIRSGPRVFVQSKIFHYWETYWMCEFKHL